MLRLTFLLLLTTLTLFHGAWRHSRACTDIFLTRDDTKVSGRTMDSATRVSSWVVLSPRGVARRSLGLNHGDRPVTWVSRYGSVMVTCSNLHEGCDGMNEHGLAAGYLLLTGTKYPPTDKNPALSSNYWVRYYVDNFKTVWEAIAQAPRLRVSPVRIGGVRWPLHLVLHDAGGDSAILEYLDGKLVIHHRLKVPVITCEPPYGKMVEYLGYYKDLGGSLSLPNGFTCLARFVRAATFLKRLPKPTTADEAVSYAFDVIQTVARPPGSQYESLWTVVRDQTNRRYHFRSANNARIRYVDLTRVNLSKGQPIKVLDLEANFEADVGEHFRDIDPQYAEGN